MIVVKQVSKKFDETLVFDRLSLEVAGGGRLVIAGPSGCGKTTLLRLIAGLELPEEGEVWLGRALASRPGWAMAPHLRGVGMVFQQPVLFPTMSVAQNIRFGCADLPRGEQEARLNQLLEQLVLDGLGQRYPQQLSGGEARRVALARALAPRPRILLMDEALTNLNPELKERTLEVVLEHLDTYRPTLVYVTHSLEETGRLAANLLRLPGRNGA
jgi:iron(III) transport system ATP-binding protein